MKKHFIFFADMSSLFNEILLYNSATHIYFLNAEFLEEKDVFYSIGIIKDDKFYIDVYQKEQNQTLVLKIKNLSFISSLKVENAFEELESIDKESFLLWMHKTDEKYNTILNPNETKKIKINIKFPKIYKRLFFAYVENTNSNIVYTQNIYIYNDQILELKCKNLTNEKIDLKDLLDVGILNIRMYDPIDIDDMIDIAIALYKELYKIDWVSFVALIKVYRDFCPKKIDMIIKYIEYMFNNKKVHFLEELTKKHVISFIKYDYLLSVKIDSFIKNINRSLYEELDLIYKDLVELFTIVYPILHSDFLFFEK